MSQADPAIRVERLGKRYSLTKARPNSLGESLATVGKRLMRRSCDGRANSFWALHDVSFRVEPGEIVGVVGNNGAGKSTLLKILSRITTPTEGRAVIRGR